MSSPSSSHRDAPDAHHEASDVNVRAVAGFGIALTVVAAAIHVLLWLLFLYFEGREAQMGRRQFPLAAEQQNRLPAEPRLQVNPRQDLAELRAREDEMLTTYGWVDRNTGVVRIPISEAMRLTVERGLPSRAAEPR